jgi:zinc protease
LAASLAWGVLVATAVSCLPAPGAAPRVAVPLDEARAERAPARGRLAAPGQHPKMREQILPSGLRLLWEEDPYATLAGVVAVVRGGSSADPAGAEGLAHLVEHLTYRAVDPLSPTAPAGERALTRWDRLIRYATADMNGFTTPDCLIFYELAPPPELSSLLTLESARLVDPLAGVDERAFALERQIVGGEHLVRADPRAGEWAATALFPLMFAPQHPYARSPGGTDETRRRLTLAQARAYAAAAFRADRITLLVTAPPATTSLPAVIAALPPSLRGEGAAAATTPGRATATAAAKRYAAPATAPAAVGAQAPAGSADSAAVHVEHLPSPLPTRELWLAWTLPGTMGELGPTEDVLQSWLQDDLHSDQVSKEEPGIRYTTAWIQPAVDTSVLFVRVLLGDHADAERVAQVVVARVASLWAREPTARADLGELRTVYETERMLDEPGQLSRVLREATDAALGGRAQSLADALAATEAVPSASVARLAYQNLTRERAHVTLFTPGSAAAIKEAAKTSGLEPTATTTAALREPTGATAAAELVPGAAAWNPAELGALLPRPPEVITTKTSTGLTVVVVRRPAAAAVAWLGFRGGYTDATPPLLVELALRTRADARQATRLHILPGRGATRDLSFEAVEFLPDQLADALTLLFAKSTATVKDWPAHDGLERLLAPVAAGEDGQAKKADRAFWRALFGDHPDARMISTEDLDKVTRSDVEAWVGRVHNVRNAALIVVGDVDVAEVERAANVLAKQASAPSWVADIATPKAPALRPASGERMQPVVTARPGSLTDIRIGCLLPPMTAAGRDAYALLGHAIEARLNTAVRIDQGDGYGVHVSMDRLRDGATYMLASTFVPEQSLPRTLAVLRAHWQRWAHAGFEPGEINVARWRFAGSAAARYADSNALAMMLLDEWSAEPASLATERLRADPTAASAARLNELFATCKANAVLGLTGNEPAIRRALTQSWPLR